MMSWLGRRRPARHGPRCRGVRCRRTGGWKAIALHSKVFGCGTSRILAGSSIDSLFLPLQGKSRWILRCRQTPFGAQQAVHSALFLSNGLAQDSVGGVLQKMKIEYAHHPDASPAAPPLAARAGDHIFVGGQMAVHPTHGIPAEAKLLPNYHWHGSSIHKQLTYIYSDLDKTLQRLGSSLPRCLKINSYHTNPMEVDMALRVR